MWLADTLANLLSGLGTAKDKTTGNIHVQNLRSPADIQAAYRTDWIARKIVDVPAFDMLREWRAWQAKDKQVEAIEAAEKALRLRGKLLEGLKLARRDGGAALVIGDGSPDPAQPLVADQLPQGGIRYIAVMSRREITAGQRERDPASEWFGEPSEYTITSAARGAQAIHPSRVIRLLGAPILDEGLEGDGWGDSVLQAVMDAVDQASSSAAYVNAMLPEAKQDVISVPGLSQHLSTAAGTKALTDRFAYAARMKSMFGMLLLEGDGKSPDGEVFEQKQISFAGLPDVVRLYLSIAAGAADIPATRLLGKSPDGQNATGDSDTRNYYDRISAEQNVDLTPRLARLDELLIRHALGKRPPEIWFRWNPLYQTSHKDNADAFNVIATAVKTLADAKVAPLEILAQGVKGATIDSGLLPGIDGAYDDHGDAPLTEVDPAPDQYDPYGYPDEGYTGTGDPGNVIPFPGRAALGDAVPRTLYVSRKLKNGDDLLAWARSQGFADLMPAGKLHVTIAYSRTAVDWMKVGQTWNGEEMKVSAGGPRLVERFGDAIVLLFASDELRWRHQEIREAGASWDHPEYQPHVTFTWNAGDVDLAGVEPYNGPLVFGPELFEPVDEDWRAGLTADAARIDPDEDGDDEGDPLDEEDEDEIADVTDDELAGLFGEEYLAVAEDDRRMRDAFPTLVAFLDARRRPHHGGAPRRPFDESKVRRVGGRFAPKGGTGETTPARPPRQSVGARRLEEHNVGGDHGIVVNSARVRKYRGHDTVESFVAAHPKGRAHAMRVLAADHKAGRINFTAPQRVEAPRVETQARSGQEGARATIDPKLANGEFRANTRPVTGAAEDDDYLISLSGSNRYPMGITVKQFAASHPKGRDAALKRIAADRKAGRLQVEREKSKVAPEFQNKRSKPSTRDDASLGFADNVSERFKDDVRLGWEAVPPGVKRRLADANIRVRSVKTVLEAMPDLKGVRPRGWPPNASWDEADGLAGPGVVIVAETRAIHGQDRYVRSQRTSSVLVHETGHGLDNALGGASDSAAFRAAYRDDVARFQSAGGSLQDDRYSYMLQDGSAGTSEMFAEMFADLVGLPLEKRRPPLSEAFPATAAHMRGLLRGIK